MTHATNSRLNRRTTAFLLVALAGGAVLPGCSNKSFLDPSINGSIASNPTPVKLPILTRLAAIEDESGELVEYSDPLPGDLIPQPVQYRLGPGDMLRVTLWDLISRNDMQEHEVEIDARGMIDLPQLGRLYVNGMTTEEATVVVKRAMERLIDNPLASIIAVAQRQQTYTLIGAVDRPGPYFVQRADFRLLEALTAGGRFDDNGEDVFVIRQVPLNDEASGRLSPPSDATGVQPTQPTGQPPRPIIDIIDDIAPPKPQTPQPGMMRSAPRQPQATPPRPPAINLPENDPPPSSGAPAGERHRDAGEGKWVFVNGKWTRVTATARTAPDGLPEASPELITQRVIRIPLKELVAGKQSVNIVVRPGDVVRIPGPPAGNIVISGQVARPGVYGLPSNGGLTLMAAIHGAAGGYSSIAIPERIDLTRRVGKDREATIMLDGAAIARREQPDFYLKPNDMVIVGTNFWALPLAVFRNGLRASYGFGFVMDRNLSNDIFGPEAVRQFQ